MPRDESMELAAAHIVPGNTLTDVISVPWQQQLQHDLRPSAWDSRSSSKPKKTRADGQNAFCQAMWMSVHIHHEANFSTMSPMSFVPLLFFKKFCVSILHSPCQVFFSLSHLDLASFLGRCYWRGTSWSTGRLGGRGATWGCNSTENLGCSLVMSGNMMAF